MEEVRAAVDPRREMDVGAPASRSGIDTVDLAPVEARTEIEVLDSIASVEPAEWDRVAGDDVFSAHGWLRSIEASFHEVDLRYVLLRRNGALLASAVCQLLDRDRPGFSPDALMFRRFAEPADRLGLSWAPAVSCVPFRGYGNHLMVDSTLADHDRERVLERLLDAVEDFAFSHGRGLWLPRVPVGENEVGALLRRRGYHHTRVVPVTFMDIEWDSFEGYLAEIRRFSRNARKTITHQIRRFERSGATISEIEDPDRYRDRLFELAEQHHRRLNHTALPYTPDFLPTVKKHMGPHGAIYGAFQDNDLIGFSLILRRGGVAHLPLLGSDLEKTRDNFAYFNLCYYRPIADAIATGMRRVYGGRALYEMKARRGFRIEGLHAFYRSPSPARHRAVGPFFTLHNSWIQRRVRRNGREDFEALRRTPPG